MRVFSAVVVKRLPHVVLMLGLLCPVLAVASGPGQQLPAFGVDMLALPAHDITDLKFHDFFKMPVGSRGLRPTEKLLQLDGKRIRILGYMVKQEEPLDGMFLLTALPVTMGDEDESLADDLPPATLFVHLQNTGQRLPYVAGLITLTGVLSVGGQEEGNGRVSTVRLLLDQGTAEELMLGVKSNLPADKL
ncbi:MAG: hypothetical protein HY080_03100 [Gammaproteobacteria bacterium]|nr:hypothetical protein [Gammaproteobacteria bacterium]